MEGNISLQQAKLKIDQLSLENQKLKMENKKVDHLRKKVKNLEQQLELMVESAGLGTWDQNFKTGKVIRNNHWAEQLGYTLEEVDSSFLQFKELVHPDDLYKIKESEIEHLSGEKKYFKVEHRMKSKSGEWKWILNIGKIIKKDKQGKPVRAVGTHLDVTDLKIMHEKLKESEQQYKNLFEYAPIGLWEQDVTDLIEYLNTKISEGVSDFEKYFQNNPQEIDNCINKIIPVRVNHATLDIHEVENALQLSENFDKIFTKKSKEIFIKQISAYINGAESFESETELKTPKGKIKKLKIFISFKPLPLHKRNVILFSVFDISKQKKAEEASAKSEEKYKALYTLLRSMADNLPDMIWAKDINKEYLFANYALCKDFLIAQDTEEPIGKSDLFFAERQRKQNPEIKDYHTFGEFCQDSDEIVLKTKKIGRFNEFGNIKNKFLFLDVYKAPFYDEHAKLIGVVGSARNITKEKAIEKALKESEERYKTLFKISPTGILIEDANGKILEANPALHKSFGYAEDELIGKNISRLAHPEMYKNIQTNLDSVLQGINLNHIVKGVKKDGTTIFNELFETKISFSNHDDAILCISNNITKQIQAETELKKNEKHYRALFYNNPQPMYMYDKNTLKFLDINEAALDKYGYNRKEILKMTILDIRLEEDIELFKKQNDVSKNKIERRGIWRHKKKNGDVFHSEIKTSSINFFGRQGELVLAHDISERLKFQADLEKSRHQIRKFAEHLETIREEERTDIAREIHDNLGQTLTAIKLDLSWLESNFGHLDEKIHLKVNSTKKMIDSSIKTIQKISTALRPGIIDDLGLIAAIEWLVDDFQQRTQIKCTTQFVPENIILEKDLSVNLFRIIQEALTNIIRHAKARNVNIKLDLEKSNLSLGIEDDGKGISKKQIEDPKSFGLIGINERVLKFDGELEISGKKNLGSRIKINIPHKL